MTAAGDRLPPRLLPILYFTLAHLFLVAAFAAVALDPRAAAGFFYQPRTIGIVHLITIGWISASILGSLYVIGPLALRMPMPARRSDYVACALFAAGGIGMTGHFFAAGHGGIGGPGGGAGYLGVAWSGLLVLAGLALVACRTLRALRTAPIQAGVKLHIALAFGNVVAAGLMGLLLAAHKARPFLPGSPIDNVFAHVHLAALGWAGMMVVGAGYRMMPMVLPAAMPAGRSLYASALFLEAGALGLFAGFLLGGRFLLPSALLSIAGFAVFFLKVRWMLANRRRRPRWLRLPDYGVLHTFLALLYALLSALLGVALSIAPRSDGSLRAAAVYGVLGLVGFLGQMVLGMQARILPMFSACHANRSATCEAPPVTPGEMGDPGLQAGVFVLWAAGVPLLAAGMGARVAAVAGTGGLLLFAASLIQAAGTARVLRHAFSARYASPGARPLPAHPARRAAHRWPRPPAGTA